MSNIMQSETYNIKPYSSLPSFSLPLTPYDLLFLRFDPTSFIFIYHLQDPSPETFYSVVLPKLKRSLSFVLEQYYPVAGRLVWPETEPKPILLYTPDDAVSLTVTIASNPEAFLTYTGAEAVDASEARRLVPELHCTDNEADALAIQVTFFCNHGVSIGISKHHALLDGCSTIMFCKAWAAINAAMATVDDTPSFPPEFAPSLERRTTEELEDLSSEMIAWWYSPTHHWYQHSDNARCLKYFLRTVLSPSLVRKTFNLSFEEAQMLKKHVWKELQADPETLRLSSFVVCYAFAISCLVRAKRIGNSCYALHLRNCSLDANLPENYFGNRCFPNRCKFQLTEEEAKSVKGFATIAKEVAGSVKDSKSMTIREGFNVVLFGKSFGSSSQVFMIGGYPGFPYYKVDFGWGQPLKIEIVAIENLGTFSIIDNKDGDGLQIQVVLERDVMEKFSSLFIEGIINCETIK